MHLQVFDINNIDIQKAKDIVQFIRDTGCLVVKDNIVSETDNNNFLDMMENYFEQPYKTKLKDARPEYSYQVGVTPPGVELSRCSQDIDCLNHIDNTPIEHRPQKSLEPDPKWRYFWRIGDPLQNTEFQTLNAQQVIPQTFNHWQDNMNTWGEKLLSVVNKVTNIIELGLDLQTNTLSDLLNGGAHLLAPTGMDIKNYHNINQVYAGYHYDISFLTIHGKSRYPGLNIWLRDGTKLNVKIPDGCLLLQVGKQLEWLTGGYFQAGYHEVVCTQKTVDALLKNKSQWRVSSTLFSHVNSEKYLEPLIKTPDSHNYPKIKEGVFLLDELKHIKLTSL